MKFIILLAIVAIANAAFDPFDLADGCKYKAIGQFCSALNGTSGGPCTPTTWAQDAANDVYFQDLGTGGQYYYYHSSAYAVRLVPVGPNQFASLCFEILNYNSSVLRSTYGAAKSIDFENGKTFHGMGGSTCGTPLSQYFRVNGRSRMVGWSFQQLASAGPQCLDVNGQIEFTDFAGNFDTSIFNLPALCQAPQGPIPGGYCANFYFPPGNQCNYAIYFPQ